MPVNPLAAKTVLSVDEEQQRAWRGQRERPAWPFCGTLQALPGRTRAQRACAAEWWLRLALRWLSHLRPITPLTPASMQQDPCPHPTPWADQVRCSLTLASNRWAWPAA